VPRNLTREDLLENFEDALDILDDSLVTVWALLKAQRAGERLSAQALAQLRDQCTAASVSATRLRKRLTRFKARAH
jgi:hypothetical protein